MREFEDIRGLVCSGKQKRKNKLILCHTSRNIEDYLSSIKNRHNGKFDRIPNYVIGRDGKVFKLLPNTGYSNMFSNLNLNRNSIVISLENLGWLEKLPLSDHYVNWIGDIYKEEMVVTKKWRDYHFWQPYTEKQIDSCVFLCKDLIKIFSINKECVGHNTKVTGVEKFEGILTRSNFDTNLTDVSPAFDFELFIKKIEDEQFV